MINLWPFQPHNMNVRIICFLVRPFCVHLQLKGQELFVNSSLPIPHVPSPVSSFQNSSIAVFMTNNQNYVFEFSYLWSSASTIVSYGASIHFHCQLVFYIVLCQWNFYLYFLLIAVQYFRGTLSSYKPLLNLQTSDKPTHGKLVIPSPNIKVSDILHGF